MTVSVPLASIDLARLVKKARTISTMVWLCFLALRPYGDMSRILVNKGML